MSLVDFARHLEDAMAALERVASALEEIASKLDSLEAQRAERLARAVREEQARADSIPLPEPR